MKLKTLVSVFLVGAFAPFAHAGEPAAPTGAEVVVTIRDWTGKTVQTVRGSATAGTFSLDAADYFNATVDYVTAFDGGTVSAAPSADVASGSVVTWTGIAQRLETEIFVQPRVAYNNFSTYHMGDPWIVKNPTADVWYVTSTKSSDGLSIYKTTVFPTNQFGYSRTGYGFKWHPEDVGAYTNFIWAPEMHCIQGRWYAYLSASSSAASSNYERPFALWLDGNDPYSTNWKFGAKLVTPGGDRWAIDGTVLDDTAASGKLYYVWSGWPSTANGVQNLYIAEMSSPTSFVQNAERILLSTPTEAWETLTTSPCKVNEGPVVLRHGNAVHIVYSCNGCWTDDYSLALLTCTDGNFTNPSSWTKSTKRLFVSRPGAYGPGHCSFTRTADGQDMIVYHAKAVSGHSTDYYNYRDVRMQPITWHGDEPVFGAPRPYDSTLTSDPLDLNADYSKPEVPGPKPVPISPAFDAAHTIICYGDSLTEGTCARTAVHASLPNYFDGRLDGVSIEEGYPYWLSTMATNGYNVIAQALAGATADIILGWQGASKLLTTTPLTLPAAANEYVPLGTNLLFNGNDGGYMYIKRGVAHYFGFLAPLYPLVGAIPHEGSVFPGASEGAMSGWLNGVHVRIKGRYPAFDGKPYQTICRTEAASAATEIPLGTRFVSDAAITYSNAIQVICAGANDGATRMTDAVFPLIEAAAQIAPRHLIVSPVLSVDTDKKEKRNQTDDTAVEKLYAARFGDHYLNSRQQLRKRGLSLAVRLGRMTPAEAAVTTWAATNGLGLIATDNVHLNTTGYAVKAYLVYEKLVQLGYVQGELLPPGPTDYGATDSAAATYTWKGFDGPWEYTTNWTASTGATYGIPNNATHATAVFPASETAAFACTLAQPVSAFVVDGLSPNGTLTLDNATLTVAGPATTGCRAFRLGDAATGAALVVLKGANAGLVVSRSSAYGSFGSESAASATGTTTVRFEVPATPWTNAPIRAAAGDSKIRFYGNVRFEVDATAVGVPSEGKTVRIPLAVGTAVADGTGAPEGVVFYNTTFDAVKARSVVTPATGAAAELAYENAALYLKVTAAETPGPEPGMPDVTLESLLAEMCDADAATRLPTNAWTGRLWSSYDRASVSPDDPATWFANNDRSQFVATNVVGGRTECVMVNAKGPGVLTRLWTANGYGTVYRFYVDGASEPVISGVGTNLIGGHVLCGAPLAEEVAPGQKPGLRAQDLYLPIPFAQSLVVTAELKDIPPDDDKAKSVRLWYNAEVRTYAAGVRVESFSTNVLERAQGAIAAANAALASPPAPTTDETLSLDGTLAAGASRSVTFTRTGAIRSLALKLAGDGEPLRTVRVLASFDGEKTVDAAAGQLFGAGYAATAYATVDGGVDADGTMTLREVMPFKTSCTVTLTNTSASACTVSASAVAVGAYEWDEARSLHFGACGFEERDLPTRRGAAGHYDLNWVRLDGKGFLVGNTLAVDNSQSTQWWGEGDEKIYVDGEAFPSYFGTGTEDFFGYAWSSDKAFANHPFLSLPLAGGDVGGRRLTTAKRVRRLDAVPFAASLKLDVEVWHWADCAMDYAPATFWYARPGVRVTPGGLEPESPPPEPEYDPATDTLTFKADTTYPYATDMTYDVTKAVFEANASLLVTNGAKVTVNKAYLGASGNVFTAKEKATLTMTPFAASQVAGKTWNFNLDAGYVYLKEKWTFQASDVINVTAVAGSYFEAVGITLSTGVFLLDFTDSTFKFDNIAMSTKGTSVRLNNATAKTNWGYVMGTSGAQTLELLGASPQVRGLNGPLNITNTTVTLRPELTWPATVGRLHSAASTTASSATITLASGVKFNVDVTKLAGGMPFTFCLLSAPNTRKTRSITLPATSAVTLSGTGRENCSVKFTKSSDNRYVYVTVTSTEPAKPYYNEETGKSYATAQEALDAARPGETVKVSSNPSAMTTIRMKPGVIVDTQGFSNVTLAADPWFDTIAVGTSYAIQLNGQATPTVADEGGVPGFAIDGTTVRIHAKPLCSNLWYGVGMTNALGAGPFPVETWRQVKQGDALDFELTDQPAAGRFYQIQVKDRE